MKQMTITESEMTFMLKEFLKQYHGSFDHVEFDESGNGYVVHFHQEPANEAAEEALRRRKEEDEENERRCRRRQQEDEERSQSPISVLSPFGLGGGFGGFGGGSSGGGGASGGW